MNRDASFANDWEDRLLSSQCPFYTNKYPHYAVTGAFETSGRVMMDDFIETN